ncbi:hypothetical protein HID58_017801 [Brassica napus]|uniref:thioglucosidase n=1 Tax=Brassica napus TaxID=3708 RepID=A0ABQ8D841_BRANA|nr:hypothetical protein HID58_017801 [Brassica napus]
MDSTLSFNAEARPQPSDEDLEFEIHKHDFPKDFIFGTAVSAFQVEGAKKGSGRGFTRWDEFTHMFPDKVEHGDDADMGVDFYTRYKIFNLMDQNLPSEDFREFAKFCFENFGDRVKNWATFNEPSVYSVAGYSKGKKAPGRCSPFEVLKCPSGDSSEEPYKVTHNQILSHLAAVEEFRKCVKCQENGGKIGIVFLRPLTYGHYPTVMQKDVNVRLPEFTKEESEKLKKSLDFVGLNYYGAFFTTPLTNINASELSYTNDVGAKLSAEQNHSPHLKTTSMGIVIYPAGLMNLLRHIQDEYKNPEIYIMENGMDEIDNGTKTVAEATNDYGRKEFIKSHILIMGKAIRLHNVRLKGYYIWSLMDNFEWERGYKMRFGLYYVDYDDNLKRHMRSSGKWLSEFLDSKESLHKCYFEDHREKGYAPKLFDTEYLDPNNWRLSYASDI